MGAALAQPQRPVVLLTGDVAFFYDRNAFWHNYPLPNLRVVLFNNHGGGIFRIIDGPRQQPELDEFFETRQTLTAENTAKDFNLRYFPVSSFEELEAALPVFFAAETGAAILEVFTDSKTNAAFFEEYRAAVKTSFFLNLLCVSSAFSSASSAVKSSFTAEDAEENAEETQRKIFSSMSESIVWTPIKEFKEILFYAVWRHRQNQHQPAAGA